ncbi:NAD-dependent epimerase/dehydratase family protein [Microlunatus soli]|uniref:Nucleoside-diphosphate-sugar epimerase n=1 Tax=Microlunatus soli TaxID=630515 RepID=A0A1H1SER7_9ACTN|nr:NAD(P)-dependent oxidoreductase [Microlunatus soli]SDS46353.1 Nucleoside-diphosphate-sugar epimerase [Microlunatus soli]
MILITGGFGTIGAQTARALSDLGREVVITCFRRTERPSFLSDRVVVEQLDITDADSLLELGNRHRISDIVHLAGTLPGDDPVAFFRNETTGMLNVINAARTWGVDRLATASSLGVYAGRAENPWHEDLSLPTVPSPHLIVGFKKAAEPILLNALQGTSVRPIVLRIGSVWGPLFDPYSPFIGAVTAISALLRGEQPAPFPADAGGDICYSVDAGRAIAGLITTDTLRHQVYNVSSGRPYTYRELAEALRDVRPDLRLPLTEPRGGRAQADPYLDIGRLRADTGFAPAFDLRAAVADYLQWRADNPR